MNEDKQISGNFALNPGNGNVKVAQIHEELMHEYLRLMDVCEKLRNGIETRNNCNFNQRANASTAATFDTFGHTLADLKIISRTLENEIIMDAKNQKLLDQLDNIPAKKKLPSLSSSSQAPLPLPPPSSQKPGLFKRKAVSGRVN